MEAVKNIQLAPERTAAWLLAVYLAIYGGDPPPQEGSPVAQELQEAAALSAIAALATALDIKTQLAVKQAIAPMQAHHKMHHADAQIALHRLGALGVHSEEPGQGHSAPIKREGDAPFVSHTYCFHFGGTMYCFKVQPPVLHSVG